MEENSDQAYFESILDRLEMSMADLRTMPLPILNKHFTYNKLTVNERAILMAERRKQKNKLSASGTRLKAIIEKQKMENELNLHKEKVRMVEESLSFERKRTLVLQEQKQGVEDYWKKSVLFWMDRLKILNEKQMAVMWKLQVSSTGLQSFQDMGILVNELDIITRDMKKTILEPRKISDSLSTNINEPLDLSVKQ